MTRSPVALALLALLPTPAAAQLQPHERAELTRLEAFEERLVAIQRRVGDGRSGVLPNEGAPAGAPAWIEVQLEDLRQQIAIQVLTGEISTAEAVDLARALGRGSRLLDDQLQQARRRMEALRQRDLTPAGPMGGASGRETWRFVMVARDTRLRDSPHLTSSGTMELTIAADGTAYGTARYESAGSWDDEIRGTVRDGEVRLEYGAANSLKRGVFTGRIAPDGTASGEVRIGSIQGTWRATRR